METPEVVDELVNYLGPPWVGVAYCNRTLPDTAILTRHTVRCVLMRITNKFIKLFFLNIIIVCLSVIESKMVEVLKVLYT